MPCRRIISVAQPPGFFAAALDEACRSQPAPDARGCSPRTAPSIVWHGSHGTIADSLNSNSHLTLSALAAAAHSALAPHRPAHPLGHLTCYFHSQRHSSFWEGKSPPPASSWRRPLSLPQQADGRGGYTHPPCHPIARTLFVRWPPPTACDHPIRRPNPPFPGPDREKSVRKAYAPFFAGTLFVRSPKPGLIRPFPRRLLLAHACPQPAHSCPISSISLPPHHYI